MQDDKEFLQQVKKESPLVGIITAKQIEREGKIELKGYCITKMLKSSKYLDTDRLTVTTATDADAVSLSFGRRWGVRLPKGYALNSYLITVNIDKACRLDMQNKLILSYPDADPGRILYKLSDMKQGKNRNGRVVIHGDIAMYFRQSAFNSIGLTVRNSNIYDTPEGQAMIEEAKRRAAGLNHDFILMYEKECERYEESASVLYEKLIDMGYSNVYYVVNEDNPAIAALPERYRRNLVWKGSSEHLERFFACRTILSTESTEHAVQLRIASKCVMDRTKDPELEYVFLQHGVMYMVSLNSELRAGFRRSPHRLHRIVVSSEAEADHFVEIGGLERSKLYVTGLAKFDRSFRYEDADRIVIMPTWRRWEHNEARDNLEATGYYKLVKTMFEAVPEELRDKIAILPHPLMAERFTSENELKDRILLGVSYDEILRSCDVLITDYSSIAYDAFYRGAKVVFCWQDKDECMEHYGEGSFLMLNEDNCFGPICMDEDEIRAAVKEVYRKNQSDEQLARFRNIVEYNDGRNSERIIEKLIEDGIIDDKRDNRKN